MKKREQALRASVVSVYFTKVPKRSHPHNSAVFDIDGVREKQVAPLPRPFFFD